MSAPDITDTINASEADLLCISLGAAKGHAWIERNRDRLTTPVISHLGALVNFFAGTVSRAPRWMQNSGLEWLWRTAMEPRLVARYAKDAVYLLSLISLSVLPLLCLRFAQRKEIRCARLEIDRSESNGLRFALKGVLTEQTLSLLSTSIRDDLGKSSLTLDLSGVTYLDSRALGYLYALRFRCDERICIVGDGGRLRLLLRLHKAKSLMTSL